MTNPEGFQVRKALKSLQSVAYPNFHTLTVRLLLVFSTGRRMFEPEELNPITVQSIATESNVVAIAMLR